MGNANSRSYEPCSDEMMANLTVRNRRKINQFDFIEPKPIPVDTTKKRPSKSSLVAKSTHPSPESSKRPSTPSSNTSTTTPEHPIPLTYETANNRRYVVGPIDNFYLPVDDDEVDRLVVLHFLLKYAFKGNLAVQADDLLKKEGTKVLDVGCGPGTWLLEMATEYPKTEFHGVDLRLMFPTTIKPANAKFTQHNFIENLPYEDNTFDIVRMRLILGFLTEKDIIQVFEEMYRVLKPSGYVEIMDCEYAVHRSGPLCTTYANEMLLKALKSIHVDIMPAHQVGTLLMTHGKFVDVHQHRVRIPIGWGGHLGEVHGQDYMACVCSMHPKLVRDHLDLDYDKVMADGVKQCAANQSHINWFVCYGQKPTVPSSHPSEQKVIWDATVVHDEVISSYCEE
ncbi:S-adenosyl-L-methionine-dependent methyltransferase [Choanephora cucurbitarum]|nr:S-adenosyl-L-methionine-dependent methyltransferase [Choanephora cucurbitarum]